MSGLTELGGVLHEEHFRILMWISSLKNRVMVDTAPIDPRNERERWELHRLINAIDDFFIHHSFEEDILFPRLRQCATATAHIAGEHAVIEPVAAGLRGIAIDLLRHGVNGYRWVAFRKGVNELFSETMNHLLQEEVAIVQRLHTLLDPATDRRLARQHLARRLSFAAVG